MKWADRTTQKWLIRPALDVQEAVRQFTAGSWLAALLAGAGTLLAIGAVTAIFDNPLFQRMTPVRPQDYIIWGLTAALVGLIAGTFIRPRGASNSAKTLSGGVLSFLAVGCPVCNKLVVLLLGTSGALTYFAPLQIFIGVGSLGLLVWTLRLRSQAFSGACSVGVIGNGSAA